MNTEVHSPVLKNNRFNKNKSRSNAISSDSEEESVDDPVERNDIKAPEPDALLDDRSVTPPVPGCIEVNGCYDNVPELPSDSLPSTCESIVGFQKKKSTPFLSSEGEEEENNSEIKEHKGRRRNGYVQVKHTFYLSNKEVGLKVMMENFPGKDLMQLQDLLVRCNWNADKAIHIKKDGCDVLTCTHHPNEPPPEEEQEPIKSESSQEELTPPNNNLNKWISKGKALSSDEEPDEETPPPPVKMKRIITHGMSSSDEEVKREELGIQKSSPPSEISQLLVEKKLPIPRQVELPRVPKKTHFMSSEEEGASDESKKPARKKHKGKDGYVPKKKKKQKKDVVVDSDEEQEDYHDGDVFHSEDSENEDGDDDNQQINNPRREVVKFFQEATNLELVSVPGCSKKKVDEIVSLRPYLGWTDIVVKFQTSKGLSTDLLNGANAVIYMRDAISKILHRCEKISKDMESLYQRVKENEDGKYIGNVTEQPPNLNQSMTLAPYQMLGLNWLYLMHMQNLNGILADEMGLGKTIQAIAFLAHLQEVGETGPHLIVVPSSTLDNWLREINVWCPSMDVVVYRGSQEERRELRMQLVNDELDGYQILLTTYNMLTSSPEDRFLFRKLSFHYVIFDEAHMLKNMASMRYQNLIKIRAKRRLCLTGTPLQNNLVELMSLLIFVMPHMFRGKIEQVKKMFTSTCKTEEGRSLHERERINHAKKIMKPFVLRRLKADVLKQLPGKVDHVDYCPMSATQQKRYDELVSRLCNQVEERSQKENSSLDQTSGIGMIMELRKAANHPLLRRCIYSDHILRNMSQLMLKEDSHREASAQLIYEDMQVMSDFELHKLCNMYKSLSSYSLDPAVLLDSGKFQTLDRLLPPRKEAGERVLVFSQFTIMLNILEEYMKQKGYGYLRLDGMTPVVERQDLIDRFNNEDNIFVFLLSTRAGGLGINLTAANYVLLHDIDYNPANDKQAEDRCHRVGQTQTVTVVRMISKGTIEEQILTCAQDKLQLQEDINSEDKSSSGEAKKMAHKLLKSALGLD